MWGGGEDRSGWRPPRPPPGNFNAPRPRQHLAHHNPRIQNQNPWQQPPPPPNMSMNPSHYADMPVQQVDWAALAQQWIQMKGTDAPPPSMPQQHQQKQHFGYHQQQQPQQQQQQQQHTPMHDVIGEAPMDLDLDPPPSAIEVNWRDPPPTQITNPHPNIGQVPLRPLLHGNLNSSPYAGHGHQNQNQGWNNNKPSNQNHMDGPPRMLLAHHQHHQIQLQQHRPAPSAPISTFTQENTGFGNFGPPPPTTWNANANHDLQPIGVNPFLDQGPPIVPHSTKHRLSPVYNKQPTHSNSSARRSSYADSYEDEADSSYLDAAKRKSLPSWIREGLEKVEREKRKVEEKERLKLEREEERRLRRIREQEEHIQGNVSKWNEDEGSGNPADEDSDDEQDQSTAAVQKSPVTSPPQKPQVGQSLKEILTTLSKEEQMEQIMMSVRRQLTHILLEVTTEEMTELAYEAVSRARQKQKVSSSASSRGHALALASLTGGALGLGGYGSDSENSDSEDSAKEDSDQAVDSDEELLAEIERKKRSFELREIALDREPLELLGGRRSRSASRGVSRSKSIEEERKTHEASSKSPDPQVARVDTKVEKSKVHKESPGQAAANGDRTRGEEKRRNSMSSRSRSRSREATRKKERDRSPHRQRSRSRDRDGGRRKSRRSPSKSRSPERKPKQRTKSRSRSPRDSKSRRGKRSSKSPEASKSRRDSKRSKSRSPRESKSRKRSKSRSPRDSKSRRSKRTKSRSPRDSKSRKGKRSKSRSPRDSKSRRRSKSRSPRDSKSRKSKKVKSPRNSRSPGRDERKPSKRTHRRSTSSSKSSSSTSPESSRQARRRK